MNPQSAIRNPQFWVFVALLLASACSRAGQRRSRRCAAVPSALRPRPASRAIRARYRACPSNHRSRGAALAMTTKNAKADERHEKEDLLRVCRVLVSFVCFVSCSGQPRPTAAPIASGALRGANVILVTIDTLRADRVGAYGSVLGLTPTIDRLASEGVRFERTYAH